MNRLHTIMLLAGVALTAGCGGPKPVTEAEAANFADETQNAWASRNVPAIESRYAKTMVGFDPADPALVTTWEKWDSLQKEFVRQEFDTVSVPERRIQVLDADTFVVSGVGTLRNSRKPGEEVPFRFTDVYQRQGETGFVIVNEHAAMQPQPKK